MAACAVNLVQELLKLAPVSEEKLQQEFLKPFGDGCPSVAQEIEVALLEKSDAFDIRSMQTFRRLLDEQVFARPVTATKIEEDSLVIDKVNLVLKQCQYDHQVFSAWRKKVTNLQNEREQQEHAWKLSQRAKCSATADLYCKACLRLEVWDPKKPEAAIASIMDFRRLTIMGKLGLSSDSKDVATLLYQFFGSLPGPCRPWPGPCMTSSRAWPWSCRPLSPMAVESCTSRPGLKIQRDSLGFRVSL